MLTEPSQRADSAASFMEEAGSSDTGETEVKVLVIDDDRMLAEFVRLALREEGYAVDIATDGDRGREMAMVHDYDVIVLDFRLPEGTGLDVIRALRERERHTPIIMLTVMDREETLVECLNAGADDYLVKPFSVGELKARVRAVSRRRAPLRVNQIRFGDLSLSRLERRVSVGEKELRLTPREYALLDYLLSNSERLVTRTELLEKVWEIQFDPGSNVVDVHVARLRAKLQRAGSTVSISTVRGTGFLLIDQTASEAV